MSECRIEYIDEDGNIEPQEFFGEDGFHSVIRNLCAMGYIIHSEEIKHNGVWMEYEKYLENKENNTER